MIWISEQTSICLQHATTRGGYFINMTSDFHIPLPLKKCELLGAPYWPSLILHAQLHLLICGWQAFCEVPSSRSIHKSMSSSFPGRCVCLEGVAAVPQPYSISSNFSSPLSQMFFMTRHRFQIQLFTISAVWQQFKILSAANFHVAQAWSTLQLNVWWFLLVVNVIIEWFAFKFAPGLEIFRVHIACASVTVSTPWGFRSACIQC